MERNRSRDGVIFISANGRGYISVRDFVGSSYQTTPNYPARTTLE